MRKIISLLALAALVTVGERASHATYYLGWADEFLGSVVECSTNTGHCTLAPAWAGPGWLAGDPGTAGTPPSWTYLGAQGATSQGRLNAREKVFFRYRDMSSTTNPLATVNLARYYTTTPPGEGALCTSVSGTFVWSVSQTFQTPGSIYSDTESNNRLLPISDFHLDTATAGQTRGYQSVTTLTGDMTNSSVEGCYKIAWQ